MPRFLGSQDHLKGTLPQARAQLPVLERSALKCLKEMETETFVMLSVRLGYADQAEAQPVLNLITEISKMLTVLRSRLSDSPL